MAPLKRTRRAIDDDDDEIDDEGGQLGEQDERPTPVGGVQSVSVLLRDDLGVIIDRLTPSFRENECGCPWQESLHTFVTIPQVPKTRKMTNETVPPLLPRLSTKS